MTSLIAWIAYTKQKTGPAFPRAIYVASDSRITWGAYSNRWDAGRKVFGPGVAPHIFGYCGDVVFPSLVIGQVASALDAGILFPPSASSHRKHEVVYDLLKTSFEARHNAPKQDFWIVHVLLEQPWPAPAFRAWLVSFVAGAWNSEVVSLPTCTSPMKILGTGASTTRAHVKKWIDAAGNTSWAIFSGFCDALNSGVDKFSGGPPQVAALFGAEERQNFGIVKDGKLYLNGLRVPPTSAKRNVQWYDENFQRINPITMKPMAGARRYVR